MLYFADLEAYGKSYYDLNGSVKAYAIYGESMEGHELLDIDTETWLERLVEQVTEYCKENDDNEAKVYFHNLGGYDGHFLLPYLLKYEEKSKKYKFSYLIESNRKILLLDLKIKMRWTIEKNGKRKKKTVTIKFRDSVRIWPGKLSSLGESVGFPKLDIQNYDILDEFNSVEEYLAYNDGKDWEYLKRDVQILKKFYEETKDFVDLRSAKITSGAQAVEELYQRSESLKKSKYWIRDMKTWQVVNNSYYGGFTWMNPKYALKEVKNVHGLDETSEYPSVMRNEPMPYGEAIHDETDPRISLKYYKCKCKSFKAKSIPFYPFGTVKAMKDDILDKDMYPYEGEERQWYINNYLLEFMLEWYEFEDLEIEFKFGFRERNGMFNDFFDEFFAFKDKFAKTGETAKYVMSKVFINNIYGKMIQNPERKSTIIITREELEASELYSVIGNTEYYDGFRIEELDEGIYYTTVWNDIQTYTDKETGEERLIAAYNPIGEKTTAIARINLLKNIMDKPDALVYCDTDSNYVTLTKEEIYERYDMHESRLGAWTYDGVSDIFVGRRSKHYLKINTRLNGKVKDYELKGGGFNVTRFNETKEISVEQYKQVEFTVENGKLNSARVPGGVLLVDSEYKFGMTEKWKNEWGEENEEYQDYEDYD